MKFYEEELHAHKKLYKENEDKLIYTKINDDCFTVETEFFECVVKKSPLLSSAGLNISMNRKMDITAGILQKTLRKLKLKCEIEIVVLYLCDDYKHTNIYVSSILTQCISTFFSLNLNTKLLSKYSDKIIINPSPQQMDVTDNYFYMVEQGGTLYMEMFKYENYEDDGIYEDIQRKYYIKSDL